ncbi:hypothetical protein KKG51_03390 [Patescibacteria group bacterium]|nr:hypothetical protein [Patescibacteria group bacterium]
MPIDDLESVPDEVWEGLTGEGSENPEPVLTVRGSTWMRLEGFLQRMGLVAPSPEELLIRKEEVIDNEDGVPFMSSLRHTFPGGDAGVDDSDGSSADVDGYEVDLMRLEYHGAVVQGVRKIISETYRGETRGVRHFERDLDLLPSVERIRRR